ncbi:unnamed protein product [Clonostachys solani]|uniref:Uncharacterized protein n=1 Tax=Clonostachys solani TaxID=160281 RepID=A0A9P0EB97_9HYPO|nr:unnamed protein product [Clonostachys solani]
MSSNGIPPPPSRSLVGKVAIVTGAGCADGGLGSGRAIAILLAEDGASVVCVDRDLALAEKTASLVSEEHAQKQHGGRGVAMQADVSSLEDCRAIVQKTKTELGRLNILVNNVGILGPQATAVNTELEDWAEGLEVNVTSMMLMSKFAVPAMLENQRGGGGIRGSIVNVGSTAGLLGGAKGLLYATSKGAVVQMTRAMAAHHGQDGIRVNTVCPGTYAPSNVMCGSRCDREGGFSPAWREAANATMFDDDRLTVQSMNHTAGTIYTPMVYSKGMTDEHREARRERTLLKSEGNAWDNAAAVRFLAGGDARWITGTVLTVDAGGSCFSEF